MLYNVVYIVRSHFKIILVPGVLTADTGLSLPASGEHWTLAHPLTAEYRAMDKEL